MITEFYDRGILLKWQGVTLIVALLNLFQDIKKFEMELTECQKLLADVETLALRHFVLVGIPVKLEVQVHAASE